MSKHFIKLFIFLALIASSFADAMIPATDQEVREFRRTFQHEIKAEMDSEGLQYEAIGIFSFLRKWANRGCAEYTTKTLKERFWCLLRENPFAARIAEAVRLGYGFDRGVCSDLKVTPDEMKKYKAALMGIGKRVSKKTQPAEACHVFAVRASTDAIAEHLRIGNALMYGADEDEGEPEDEIVEALRFIYTPASLASDKALEERLTITKKKRDKITKKGLAVAKTFEGLEESTAENIDNHLALELLANSSAAHLKKVRGFYGMLTGFQEPETRIADGVYYSFLAGSPKDYENFLNEEKTSIDHEDESYIPAGYMFDNARAACEVLVRCGCINITSVSNFYNNAYNWNPSFFDLLSIVSFLDNIYANEIIKTMLAEYFLSHGTLWAMIYGSEQWEKKFTVLNEYERRNQLSDEDVKAIMKHPAPFS